MRLLIQMRFKDYVDIFSDTTKIYRITINYNCFTEESDIIIERRVCSFYGRR